MGFLAPASALIPSTLAGGGGTVTVDTSFPFEDEVRVSARAGGGGGFPVYIRVPGWASGDGGSAQLVIDGQPNPIDLTGKNGTLVKIGDAPSDGEPLKAALQLRPTVRMEQWAKGGYSVHRGVLMYSWPIEANYTTVAHHFGDDDMSNDYDTDAKGPWQFALQADPADPSTSLTFEALGFPQAAPFNHSGFPVAVRATLRALPGWGTDKESATDPPTSPACTDPAACGEPQSVLLVPHGSTDLRIGQFPLA